MLHSKKPLVVCIGSFFTNNFGDQAIYHSLERTLIEEIGADIQKFPIKAISATLESAGMSYFQKVVNGIKWLPSHYLRLWKTVRPAQAVTIGGGHLIHDLYMLTPLQFLLTCLTVRLAFGKFLIVTIGAGPLSTWWNRLAVSLACLMSRGVIVRDTYSYSVIKSCFGSIRFLRKEIVPDPALVLRTNNRKRNLRLPKRIGISVSFWSEPGKWPGGTEEKYNLFLDRFQRLILLINEEFGSEVVLFSTCLFEDEDTLNKMSKRLKHSEFVNVASPHSLEEVLDLTASLDLLVSSRLHPALFALSQGVPSIVLTNEGRVRGIFSDLNIEELLFTVDDFRPEEIIDSLRSLHQGRGQKLMENIRRHQAIAARGLRNIAAEVKQMCE